MEHDIERWRSRLLAHVDSLVPAHVDRTDPTALRRARLVVGFAGAVVVYVPIFGLASWGLFAAPLTALAIVVLGLGMGLAPVAQWFHSSWLGAQVLTAALWATIMAVVVVNGGPRSQVQLATAVLPVLAAAAGSLRSGAVWVVVAATGVVALHVSAEVGVVFPEDLSTSSRSAFAAMVGVAVPALLYSLTALFDAAATDAQRQVVQRESEIRSIVDTAPDAILVLAADGAVVRVNQAACALFAASEAQLLGAATAKLFDEPPALDDPSTTGREVLGRRLDGGFFAGELSLSHLETGSGEERLIAVVRDISVRKEAERAIADARDRAVEASRAKSAFLANMSHELRTPLNAIIGYGEMVDEELGERGEEALVRDVGRILGAGRHLLQLINDILDLSKIEAGKLMLQTEPVALHSLVGLVATTLSPVASEGSNVIQLEVAEGVGTITGDSMRIRQVLLNLVSNALKFTQGGTVTIRARREALEHEPERVVLEIEDSGIGMSEAQLAKVFDEFVQADDSTTRRHGGTGLGLAICRRLVRLMGGEIQLTSEVGVGTLAVVQLPVVPQARQAATPRPVAARPVVGGVLVVDDDPWARELLERTLSQAGLPVVCAEDGTEGLRLAVALRPRVIVLDVLMPGMDGWEVLGQLKRNPETADIPVVVVTMTHDRSVGVALGAADFLTKPFDRKGLLDILRRLRARGREGHALVVEDDPDMRELVTRTLARADWTVTQAENGVQGLEAIERTVPDVVLLDLMMPEMDGFELLRRIRERPELRGLPVVVITAKELTGADMQALKGSVARVLQKGAFARDDLLQEVLGLVGLYTTAVPPEER